MDKAVKIEKDSPIIAFLSKDPSNEPSQKAARDYRPVLDEVSGLLLDPKKPVDVMLLEAVTTGKFANQKPLCIYCLGAIDAVSALLDILGKPEQQSFVERVDRQ